MSTSTNEQAGQSGRKSIKLVLFPPPGGATGTVRTSSRESESESEMFLFDPYQKYIQSNNETILDQGTPTKTSLVANIRAAYYIINNYFFISQAIKIHNKVIHDHARMSL